MNRGDDVAYTPNAGFHGVDTFTYTISDGRGGSAIGTVIVRVNRSPLAFDERFVRPHGELGQFTIPAPGLRDLVEDHDGDPLTLVLTQDGQHGNVTINQDGSFRYTTNQPDGRILDDHFLFAANDGFVTGNSAIIRITVANQPPTTEDFVNDQVERGAPFIGSFSLDRVIHDDDGDPLTIHVVTPPQHGTLTIEDQSFTYVPFVGAVLGSDSFAFRVNDGYVNSNVSTYSLSVPNRPPRAQDLPQFNFTNPLEKFDGRILVPADSAGVNVANNDLLDLTRSSLNFDPDFDPIFAELVDEAIGSATVNPDGSWSYRPNPGFRGPDSFTYKVSDGFLDSNVATVHITVVGPPQIAALTPMRRDGLVREFDAVVLNREMQFGERADSFVIDKRDDAGNWLPSGFHVVQRPSSGSTAERSEVEFTLSDGMGADRLPDGHYRLTVQSSRFTGWYGVPLDGDLDGLAGGNYVIEFESLFGDLDEDGQRDGNATQSVTLPTASGQSVTLTASPGTLIYNAIATTNPPFLDIAPSAAIFPLGFFDFQLVGLPLRGSATVTMTLPPGLVIHNYYKFGVEFGFLGWHQFSYRNGTGALILDDNGDGFTDRIVLHFIDGERGDTSRGGLVADGIIHDPGGPAFEQTAATEPLFNLLPINGPSVAVPGQLRSYSVSFTDGTPASNYTAVIDWGDGTIDSGFVSISSLGGVTEGAVSFWHTYKALGDRIVRLTLRDTNGNVRTADLPVTVQLVTFQPDPLDSTRRSLVVGGFDSANDQIVFQPGANGVHLSFNGHGVGPFAFDGSIVAFGQGGHDTIRVDQRLTRSAMLFGQDGNDILVGSAGTNVLVGGAGDDQLFGYAARDLLFGGLGADVLNGHGPSPSAGDSDLLCSDYSAWEYDPGLLASLHHRWQSSANYAERLQNLRYAVSPALNDTTVFNDFAADRLIGGAGLDWFLFSALDELMDVEQDEQGLGVALPARRR